MTSTDTITSQPCQSTTEVADFVSEHLRSLIAPMDGMWQDGFIAPAPHWTLYQGRTRAGYFVVDDEGTLLTFYVCPTSAPAARSLFDHVHALDVVQKATVATVDPAYLASCLDVQTKVRVHTLLYALDREVAPNPDLARTVDLRLVETAELDRTIAFQEACLGGDTSLNAWLRSYSTRLISRGELLVLHRGEDWLGLGEQRESPSQDNVTDLGMMVHPDHRGQGWATWILAALRERTTATGRTPICSTTIENVGAQKAIARAGFTSRHRMIDITW